MLVDELPVLADLRALSAIVCSRQAAAAVRRRTIGLARMTRC